MTLRLAPTLALPLEAAPETFGFLAVRGAGKTNAARVLAEEMFAAGVPFVAVDPVGSWYGLRSSRDGKSPGLPIPIFGGKHGDVPLEKGGGNLLADVVVDQRLSCVLDLCQFDSETSKKTFLLDFARRLYQRNEEPLHLFLEEADDYIPQRPMRDEAQLLRAWENIVRRGRARGLGITLITQRSASLNKNVLTQVQTLIAMRTTGPQDRAAIEDWLKYHAQSREILESLPSLDDGEAWVWSPRFLGKTTRFRFRLSTTLDSGRTPKLGQAKKSPATLADVDLVEVQRKMAATIERAKATDPKELRARVAQLERELAAKPKAIELKLERVEVPVLGKEELKALNVGVSALKSDVKFLTDVLGDVAAALAKVSRNGHGDPRAAQPLRVGPPRPKVEWPRPPARSAATDTGSESVLRPRHREMLQMLARYEQMGQKTIAQERLAVAVGLAPDAGNTRNLLGALHAQGLIERSGGQVRLTPAGRTAAGPTDDLGSHDAIMELWRSKLRPRHRQILDLLAGVYPAPLRPDEIGRQVGLEPESGNFRNILGRLSSLGLIVREQGMLTASENLFP